MSDAEPTTGRKRVGLALGGGGARGMAHVGVIRVLEREGVPIDCIAGTSAGSLAGAAYAGGIRGHDLVELALNLRWRDIVRPVWPRQGFFSFARLEAFMAELLDDPDFADLEIPYAAMAADLATGELVVLKEGRVAPAVQASCSVPGIVTPVEIDGRLLADGGVINNLPISTVRSLGADMVIAVGLGWPPGNKPKGPLQAGATALELLLIHAGDDPASADVHLPIPIWGLGTLVRTSQRHRFLSQGQQAAEGALPAIWEALE